MSPSEHRLRVAVCATHPIQYQGPLWRKLAAQPDFSVHAFFGSNLSVRGYKDNDFGVRVRWDVPITDGYAHTFLSEDPSEDRITFWTPKPRHLRQRLQSFQSDVVVLNGYNSRFDFGALIAARRVGAATVMRHEASDRATERRWFKDQLRDSILRLLYRRVTCFAAIGQNARNHLLRLGVPDARIGWAPYCVDSDLIQRGLAGYDEKHHAQRRRLGVAGQDFVLLFSGKLIEKKDPLIIAAALERVPAEVKTRLHWVVMGSGVLKDRVVDAGVAQLGTRFHFAGFVNQSEMSEWYAGADCLILPSRRSAGETWGLVVNEALQFGIPAIVSDGVGCAPDLVTEDQTGFVFAAGDADQLAARIVALATTEERKRRAMSESCRQRAAAYSLDEAANGLAAAVRSATGSCGCI